MKESPYNGAEPFKDTFRMTDIATAHTGGCLCGAVRYRIRGTLRGAIACHCEQCRRTSGHHAAMTSVPSANLMLTSSDRLVWYKSSEAAERGFCGVCGSNLFWRPFGEDRTAITAGTLDVPTNIKLIEHIFVADKADYYEINDELPKRGQWS
jgi:hypothetical protein